MIVSLLLVDIVCDEPFAVRAPEEPEAVDLPIARDPEGNVFVPATSLAGSLRAHLRSLGIDEELMGSRPPVGSQEEGLEPSAFRLLGTRTTIGGAPIMRSSTVTRGHTAIDRERASAGAKTLRTTTVAPAGSMVRLYMRHDGTLPEGAHQALASWVPYVGGSRTAGQGRAHIERLLWGELDLARPQDLKQWLLLSGPELVENVATQPVVVPPPAGASLLSEHVLAVPGLALPDDAVELFVARAKMARAEFRLTAANRDDVANACARLDGIPLAIVLAAGAVRTVDPAGLVRRLEAGSDLSSARPTDLPSHHRTLTTAIASSWNLLSDEARDLLASLAVFAGGFTPEAAAAVDGRDLPETSRLLDDLSRKSLAEARPDAPGGPRFELLETIRDFASAQLDESGKRPERRTRHGAYFAAFAEDLGRRLIGPDQVRCKHAFADEFENLGIAFQWAVDRDPSAAVRLAASLWRCFLMGDIPTGRRWLDQALAAAPEPSPARAVALAGSGALAWVTGHPEKAERQLGEAAELAARLDLADVVALVLVNQGALAEQQDRFDDAEERFAEALLLYDKLEDRRGRAVALNGLGMILRRRERVNEAWPLWTEAASLFRAVGDGLNEAIALGNKAWAAEVDGRLEEAFAISEECRRIQIGLGDTRGLAATTAALGRIAAARGALEDAKALHLDALAGFERLADLPWVASTLVAIGAVAARSGALDRAVTLLGAAEAIWDQMGVRPREDEGHLIESIVARCRDDLAADRYVRAIGDGRAMSLADAIAFAGR